MASKIWVVATLSLNGSVVASFTAMVTAQSQPSLSYTRYLASRPAYAGLQ